MLRLICSILVCVLMMGCEDPESPDSQFSPTEISLSEVPDRELMELSTTGLVFTDAAGNEWVAPKGTWTDGASVPRLALAVTDGRFDRAFLKAAVVHDAYCQEFNEHRCPDQYRRLPWQSVHRMFYEACVAGDTPKMKAKLMFAAVWLFGPRWDDPDSSLDQVPDEVLLAGLRDCQNWIDGSDPTPLEIESWITKKEPAVIAISRLESTGISLLEAGSLDESGTTLKESEALLNQALKEAPDDLMLLSLKGYHHRNEAIRYKELKMDHKVKVELDSAVSSYQKVIRIEPEDVGALNNISDALIMNNKLDLAEDYIEKTLNIEPDHPEALKDLKQIQTLRHPE